MPKHDADLPESAQSSDATAILAAALSASSETNRAIMQQLAEMQAAQTSALARPPELDRAKLSLQAKEAKFAELPQNEDGSRYVPCTMVPCRSLMFGAPDKDGVTHGATFTAEVQNGKTIRFHGYRIPDAVYVSHVDGGLCPFGHNDMYKHGMARANGTREEFRDDSQHTDKFKQWLYELFYRADAGHYIGRPSSLLPVLPPDLADAVAA